MTRQEAQDLLDEARALNVHLNNIAELLELVSDVALQRKLRLELGKVMGITYLGFMRPALTQFPEFDPDVDA